MRRFAGSAVALIILTRIAVLPDVRAADYWLAPPDSGYTGTPETCTQENPMPYATAEVQRTIRFNPKAGSDPTVRLYFTLHSIHGGYGTAIMVNTPYTDGAADNPHFSPNHRVAVGTGWLGPTGYARAFVKEVYDGAWRDRDAAYSLMLNLNDAHLTWMPSGWVLTTAEAVNSAGWIVGNGTVTSGARGFVLVPQFAAGQ